MELSVVIPALNEEKNISSCIKKALKIIKALNIEGEVVVADNGSNDNTVKVAENEGARVVHAERKGYGYAYMEGFNAAKGKFFIMADADDTYNFEDIAPYYEKLKEGYDFIMGNRFKGKIEKGAMPFLHHYLGTPALSWLMNLFFRTGIGDAWCGMRGLTKNAFHKMRLKAGGMEFALEMVIKASLLKLKIAEVPCDLFNDKKGRKSHLNTWRDGWLGLRFILLFTPSWTFLIPGSTLFCLGTGGMIAILCRDVFAPNLFGSISQYHLLLSLLMFFLGAQIVGLGLIAQSFSFFQYFYHASRTIKFLHNNFKLEKGILSGGLMLLLSICSACYLVLSDQSRVLPYLTGPIRFDVAIFSIAFLLLGVQFIFTSFVLSLFYLKIK